MPDFVFTPLDSEITVTDVITVHYFEYRSDFYFAGERHDFWEFLFVDKGEVLVMTDDAEYTLTTGDIIFHEPNEFHNVRANGVVAPNLVVIAFSCASPAMDFFRKRILKAGERERTLLAKLVNEALLTFSSRLDDPFLTALELKERPPFGSLQMIKIYLEAFFLGLIRREAGAPKISNPMGYFENFESPQKTIRQKNDLLLYRRAVAYLQENIGRQLTMEQICQELSVGSSQLQKLFSAHDGCGVIHYFSRLKIDAAKQYIRADNLNFTQISEALGYSSVHYFSRQFKKFSGMTPSQYAYSVKAKMSDSLL